MKHIKNDLTLVVTCDNEEQCQQLEEIIDQINYDYRNVVVCIPDDDDNSGYMTYFSTLEEAVEIVRNRITATMNTADREYTFYKLPYITWEKEVYNNEAVKQLGQPIARVCFTVKVDMQETSIP